MQHPESYFDSITDEAACMQLSIPIFSRLTELPSRELHFLFSQIYYFVEAFPGFLGALILQAPNEKMRFAIIENLVDECGGFEKIHRRDYSETHSGMLKKFVTSLTCSNGALADKSIHVDILLNNFRKLFIHSGAIETFAAVASMEGMSTSWFKLLYKQLQDRNEFSSDDLYFFELHTRIDEEHGNALKEELVPLLKTAEDYALFKSGVMTSTHNWTNFYQGLAEEMQAISVLTGLHSDRDASQCISQSHNKCN